MRKYLIPLAAALCFAFALRTYAVSEEPMLHEREYLTEFLVKHCGEADISARVGAAGRILDIMSESGLNLPSAADIWLRESGGDTAGGASYAGKRASDTEESLWRISGDAVRLALYGARG